MNQSAKVLILLLAMLPFTALMAAAQGTSEIYYQGYLKINGKVANGLFDFIFTLYDGPDPFFANRLGDEVPVLAWPVDAGYFTVKLDFGPSAPDIFDGSDVWLETCVRESGTTQLICLGPLPQIHPVPYATFAINSTTSGNSEQLDGLDSTDFLRRTAGCDICIGHADNNGSSPSDTQCFDLSSNGRNNGNYLKFSGDVDGNDRMWIWMVCP